MEYKRIYVVLFIVFMFSVFLGVTFSFWQWQSTENTAVVFDVKSGQSCASVNGGGNITSSEIVLAPASCTNSKFAIKREINITPVITEGSSTSLNLWLDINILGTGLSDSQNFKYVLTTSDSSCTEGIIASGNFNGKTIGDTVPLLSEKTYETETVDTYYLYVWLDSAETSSGTMYQSFDLSIGGTCAYEEILDWNVTFDPNGGGFTSVSYTISGEHTYTIPSTGEYQLEVWGAQGGSADTTYIGGYGGYSTGTISLNAGTNLFLNVGGQGASGTPTEVRYGGYNGGGNVPASTDVNTNRRVAGGGGASHIALVSGELKTLNENINDILIVAGGGGGGYDHDSSGYYGYGGVGGGYLGGDGTFGSSGGGSYGIGGSQISPGYAYGEQSSGLGGFGYGGDVGDSYVHGSAGGGGYYGGGAAKGINGDIGNSAGGGGSGYIGNSLLTNKAMYCYNCTTSSAESTLTYTTTNVSGTATANYAKSGDGAAKITQLSFSKDVTYGVAYGGLPTPEKSGYTFLGWNTKSDGTGQTITSESVVNTGNDHVLYAIWEENEINPISSYSCANASVGSSPYDLTYTGNCTMINDGSGNWRVKFLTTGTLTVARDTMIDAFLVGGGGGGGTGGSDEVRGGGGGGGYTNTTFANINGGEAYSLVIGAGGASGTNGGDTTGFGSIAFGGESGFTMVGGTGGSGGGSTCSSGSGGSDGSNGGGYYRYGTGQGTTTREFGESTGALYAGGGACCGYGGGGGGGGAGGYGSSSTGGAGTANTGGGGGGGGDYSGAGGSGGSGIVIIRNSRNNSGINQLPSVAFDFTYTGKYTIINDNDGNWRIKFLTSGTFTPSKDVYIDAFLVGGGGGGGTGSDDGNYGGGGGGGYTTTTTFMDLNGGDSYLINIGAGGGPGAVGGNTTGFGSIASGGAGGSGTVGGAGGSGGGSGGGAGSDNSASGGSDGSNGGGGYYGTGQGRTTREFGEDSGTLYSGGGGGAHSGGGIRGGGAGGYSSYGGASGALNTGGGGGGGGDYYDAGGSGGSGILIIRNARD